MLGLLSKITIIVLATFIATHMPNYINGDVEGFVPSDDAISKNLHIDTASVSSQISSMDVGGDMDIESLGQQNTINNSVEKNPAYNEKSGKVLGEVSEKAINNDNPIIACEDADNCFPTNTPTPAPTVTTHPKPTITTSPQPTDKPIPTPTEIPGPTVTLIPLPSKFPTKQPCPPIPVEDRSVNGEAPCVY